MTAPGQRSTLRDLEVLAVDCQATVGRPGSGFLLELAWVQTCAADLVPEEQIESAAEASLFRLPRGARIPPQVMKITGIRKEELKKAPTGREIWERFRRSVGETAARNGSRLCPTVIHFHRYEEPFLRQMHADEDGDGTFPLEIICTHQIMSRLYPGLPRKGLRAAAGFFGCAMPELRRGRQHVKATSLIWRHLVQILEAEQDLTDLSDLKEWLSQSLGVPVSKAGRRVYPMEKKLRTGLPEQPGLYRMYRLNGDILYVGKAGSLKRRVNSYFQPQGRHAEHILEMLSQAKDLTFTTTGTALEAGLMEADEIKRLAPLYNRALQKNGRRISYASRDLLSFRSTGPDRKHTVGPLTTPSLVSPLGPLAGLLSLKKPRISARTMEQILDIPGEYFPDRHTFRLGIQAFFEVYGELIPQEVDLPALMALGARFWKDKLEKKAAQWEGDTGGPSDELPEDAGEEKGELELERGTWTPERIVKTLRGIVRTGTYQIRRARWLLRLHESSLAWRDGADPGLTHVVILENGRPCFPVPIPGGSEAPIPAGNGRPLRERQAGFDVAAYDRLRVFTTEIRRLCSEGRVVELRLHPAVRFTQPQLRKMLPWV